MSHTKHVNVSTRLHRHLKRIAAEQGKFLTEFVDQLLEAALDAIRIKSPEEMEDLASRKR